MLQNAYLLAKIGADTAENEQHFAENLLRVSRDFSQQELRPCPMALRLDLSLHAGSLPKSIRTLLKSDVRVNLH